MNFSCSACGRAYSIADERVKGRSFRVTCRQCGTEIRVPAARPAGPRPPPVPQPRLTPPTTHVAGEGHAPPAGNTGMTDDEMAWLAGGDPGPRAPAAAEAPAEVEAEVGVEVDVPAAQAVREPAPQAPAVPAAASAPVRRGPGPFRAAAAAALVLAAAGLAAWQLGWLSPASAPPRPVASAPAPVPSPPPAAAPAMAPAPAEPPPVEAAAAPAGEAPPPSPGAGPARVPAPRGSERDPRHLRIGSRDRRLLDLLDRKGDSSLAAPVERSTLDTGRAELDAAAVERTLAENRGALASCVTRALKADPDAPLDRKATLLLTVRPDGTVSRARIAEADLEGTALGRCLSAAGRRVVFPAFAGEALEVAAPLALGTIR